MLDFISGKKGANGHGAVAGMIAITLRAIGGVLYASTYDTQTRKGSVSCIQPPAPKPTPVQPQTTEQKS